MNERNSDQLIHAFLQETRGELPERAYAYVRHEIDRAPQRIVLGPWRTPFTNSVSRYALAAAAGIVLAVVAFAGLGILSARPSLPGVTPTNSPQTPTPPPTVAPAPTTGFNVTVLDASEKGAALPAGTYSISIPARVTYTFTVPSGWWLQDIGSGRVQLYRTTTNPDLRTSVLFLDGVKAVYADPCNAPRTATPVDQTVPAIVAALSHENGYIASPTVPVQLNGATGSTFTVDIMPNSASCSYDTFAQWLDPSDFDSPPGGTHERLWVLDLGQGSPVVAQVSGIPTTTLEEQQSAEDVVNLMSFR